MRSNTSELFKVVGIDVLDSERAIAIRSFRDKLFQVCVVALSFASTLPLLFIFFYIFKEGISSVNWHFLMNSPKPVGESGGGIANAVIGSAILIALSCFLSIPLGITAGVYLSEKGESKLAYGVRLCVEVLQGVPSIVIGIVAYIWVVMPLRSFSALSGAVALAIMMLPITIRATEETLKLIPHQLREASLALGVPYHRTVLKVILPAGLSGIVSGILLSIARIAGETAPLLFTAFGSPFVSFGILKPISTLPHVIFLYAISPYEDWHALGWGAAFILILLVLAMNFIARLVTRRWKAQF